MSEVVTIGNATLYHGDCRGVTRRPGPLITDPPYGVNLGTHGGAKDGRPDHVLVKAGYENYADTPEQFATEIAPILAEMIDVCPRAAVFCPAPLSWLLPPPSLVGGVYLPAAQGRNKWGFTSLAPVLFYGRSPNLHKGCTATVICSSAAAEESQHPCPKPLRWMNWLIGLVSLPSETVFDPFMGSGTTGVAAVSAGRKFVGIEIERKYFDIACERIENAQRQTRMFA